MQNEKLQETYAALEESPDRYVDLYDFAPVGYLTLDEKGVVVEINLTGAGMLDRTRVDIVDTPFVVHLDKGEQKRFFGYLQRVMRKLPRS